VIDTKQKILRAAAHLFSRSGYSGTTTQQIAKRARVAETSIYRHFKGKDELFVEAVRQAVTGVLSSYRPEPAESLEGTIELALRYGFKVHRERPGVLHIVYFALLENHKSATSLIAQETEAIFKNFAGASEQLRVDGCLMSYLVGAVVRQEHYLHLVFGDRLHSCTGLVIDLDERIHWLANVIACGLRHGPDQISGVGGGDLRPRALPQKQAPGPAA
jgi:AcrR family transcriptional regulator